MHLSGGSRGNCFNMIVKVQDGGLQKWKCTVCDTKWLPRKDEIKQLRCPNLDCRKLGTWRGGRIARKETRPDGSLPADHRG
jgi:hypothetical protein